MAALLAAYREGCAESGRTGSATAHVQLSWADTDEQATQKALGEWPMAGLRFPKGDIRSPFDVAQLVRSVTADDLRERMPLSSDPDVHRAHLQSFLDLGSTRSTSTTSAATRRSGSRSPGATSCRSW